MISKKQAEEIYERINNKRHEINEYERKIEHKILSKEKFSQDEIIEYIDRKIKGENLYGMNYDLDKLQVTKAFKNIKTMIFELWE